MAGLKRILTVVINKKYLGLPAISVVLFVIFINSCVKPFQAPPTASNLNYLVVDGTIIKGSVTTIKLSRTRNINDTATIIPEKNAQLFIEGKTGALFNFQTSDNGVYTSNTEAITENDQYRLRIITGDGKEYISDYVPVKIAPEIDSLEWNQDYDVFIYLNTHDPSNNTKYYRWDFIETSEYHSAFDSYLEFVNGEVVILKPEKSRYTCYKYFNSSDILVESSAALSEDVINHALITKVPNDYTKFNIRYSILVKQYALTQEGYKYWQLVKLSTEQTGNIFDPQPSQLNGNIHSSGNPSEPVIGFISASSVTEKRIFIKVAGLKDRPRPVYDSLCKETSISPAEARVYLRDGNMLPTIYTPQGALVIAPKECVDCSFQGGVTEKPSYW